MVRVDHGARLKGRRTLRNANRIPGTDLLQIIINDLDAKTVYAEKLKVSHTGEVTVLETVGPWRTTLEIGTNPDPREITWSPDGKHNLGWETNKSDVTTFEPGATQPTFLYSNKINGHLYGLVGGVAPNAQTSEAAILFHKHGLGAADHLNWVEILDMPTKAVKGRVPLPWYTEHVEFSPDGQSLITRQLDRVTIVNYRQYLEN